jgi:nucleotide-binding universal stress UspA family protein
MPPKIIVSYDGTNNEDDAIALGRLFARAGAELSLAYVRHSHEHDSAREAAAQREADAVVARGVQLLGQSHAEGYVVTDRSTPAGLRALAERERADVVVFCSDSHTAQGHIGLGNSAERLLEGGTVAVAIAPAGLAKQGEVHIARVAATGNDGDNSAHVTARTLARALGAEVAEVTDESAELLVIGSRPEAEVGHVSISASAEYLLEIATSSVLVVPRGIALAFGSPAPMAA